MWHVSSRSGVATLRTAIHLLLTYLLTYYPLVTVVVQWILRAVLVGEIGSARNVYISTTFCPTRQQHL